MIVPKKKSNKELIEKDDSSYTHDLEYVAGDLKLTNQVH